MLISNRSAKNSCKKPGLSSEILFPVLHFLRGCNCRSPQKLFTFMTWRCEISASKPQNTQDLAVARAGYF
jgi:hypothetical protein